MKYTLYLLLAFFSASTSTYALQPKVEILEQFDNLKLVALISVEDIKASPEWNPDMGAPPLTVEAAVKAVNQFHKTDKKMAIREIEIRPLPGYPTRWHYLVKVANDALISKYSLYVVLMDGKIIPASIEPEGYK